MNRWLGDRRRAVALAVVVLLVAGGVAVAWDGDGSDETRTTSRRRADVATRPQNRVEPGPDGSTTTTAEPTVRADAAGEAVLLRFDDCAAVLDHARAQALEHVTPYGLPWHGGGDGVAVATDAAAGSERSAAPSASGGSGGDSAAQSFSTTNVQEAGVDEPDVVKNDGERAFTIGNGRLRAVLFDGDGLRAGDTLALDVPDDAELLEVGDNLVVLSSGDGVSTRVVVVDARDPHDLQVTRQIDVEGAYLSARRIGDTVRLVVTQNGPAFEFTYPQSNDEAEVARALAHNRTAIRRARLAEWLPDVTFDGTRRLVPAPSCGDVYLTPTFAGPGSTTVVTLSPAQGKVLDATAVLATATEVYATAERLYVATSAWNQTEVADLTTEIHRFDVSDPTRSVYEATGTVPGHLLRPPWFVGTSTLGQWALSEHDGHLRVATTTVTDNVVTVLRRNGEALLPAGVLAGLGRGEQIYAVRFMGTRGYVVTYRKVDPLFVLDLTDPTAPRVVGELKVPGYSAYLHPIGDGLLLGIGQDDPDEDGLADGTQVSVFDVSDPARPERLAQMKLGERGTLAGVEADHRTFTWWPDPARAVLTLTNWEDPSKFHGAVALDVQRGGIREVGRVEHRPGNDRCPVPVTRSRVIGDALVTFSAVGVRSNSLGDLAPRSTLQYDGAPDPGPCSRPPTTSSTSSTSSSTTTTALPLRTGRN